MQTIHNYLQAFQPTPEQTRRPYGSYEAFQKPLETRGYAWGTKWQRSARHLLYMLDCFDLIEGFTGSRVTRVVFKRRDNECTAVISATTKAGKKMVCFTNATDFRSVVSAVGYGIYNQDLRWYDSKW